MPAYRVSIRGQNFLMEMADQLRRIGFYTTRELEAADPGAAEDAAIGLLRGSETLMAAMRNTPEDPPTMVVEEIQELEGNIDPAQPTPGFAFFDDDGDGTTGANE